MSLPWSSKGLKVTPVGADELMIIDSADANPSTQNKRITINSLDTGGEANTSSNSGTGLGWAQTKVGVDLPFKSLITTAPIVSADNADDLTVSLDPLVNADISPSALIAFSKLASLSDGNLLIGSNTNVPTSVAMSGDATIVNSGLLTIGNNVIDDNKIAIQTSTKISINNKLQLNSNLVYTDQSNTFGSFAQVFPNTFFQLSNPAATFNYNFVTSAITANRNVIFPILSNNDTLVFVTETQTLANKTLTVPTITNFSNATHDHSDASGGGNLTNTALTSGVFSNITGVGVQIQNLDMGNNLINFLAAPSVGTDAATKQYVDDLVNGLSFKSPARVATTGNITLSGNQSIDGVLTATSDRVLVKDQTLGEENGVYESDPGAWSRTADADSESDLLNMAIFISEGTANQDTQWVLSTDAPIVVDTTVLEYVLAGISGGSPLTTKGDIFGYSTADTRVPVGTDGQVLTANSVASEGVDWQTPVVPTQTPWLQDIDAAGFDLANIPTITFTDSAEPTTPAAGELIMWSESLLGEQVLRYKGDNGIAQTIVENNVAVARNDSGVTIFKGNAVYIVGESAGKISVELAKSDVDATLPAVGVAQEDIPNATDGFILSRGILTGVDTSSFLAGDVLYVSDTVAGDITDTVTTHPSLTQVMGVVTSVNASTGTIQVTTSQVTGGEFGTNKNDFLIGDGLAGTKSVTYTNDFTGALEWTPTAARTLTLPDITDSIVSRNSTDVFTNKEFEDDGVVIQNPANTFNYTLQSSAILADRTITIPLLATSDTLVFNDHTQTLTNKTLTTPVISSIENTGLLTLPTGPETIVGRATTDTLTNKTIDGDDNTIIDINETQMNVSVGAAGAVLTSNGVGFAPTYQTAGGGPQTPWTSDIDADGFDLQDLSNLEFRNSTGAPGGTISAIWADANDMNFNVPTLDGFNLRVAGTPEYKFNETELDLLTNNLILSGGFMDITAISTPADPDATEGRMYVRAIDASNNGLFMKIKRIGVLTEVQII